jgi:hypothetical protein
MGAVNLLKKSFFRGNNSTRARKSIDRNLGKKLIRIWRVTRTLLDLEENRANRKHDRFFHFCREIDLQGGHENYHDNMKTRLPGSGRTRENLLQKSVFRGNNSTRARKSIDRNLGKKLIRIWRVTPPVRRFSQKP